jgi:copper chaperone
MTTEVYHVPGISCGHCTRTIERELQELAGVKNVKAEIDSKRVTVSYEAPANEHKITELLNEIGYPISNN